MQDTIEKQETGTNVRFFIPKDNHERILRIKRHLQAQTNEDLTVIKVYLDVIEKGLFHIERSLGLDI